MYLYRLRPVALCALLAILVLAALPGGSDVLAGAKKKPPPKQPLPTSHTLVQPIGPRGTSIIVTKLQHLNPLPKQPLKGTGDLTVKLAGQSLPVVKGGARFSDVTLDAKGNVTRATVALTADLPALNLLRSGHDLTFRKGGQFLVVPGQAGKPPECHYRGDIEIKLPFRTTRKLRPSVKVVNKDIHLKADGSFKVTATTYSLPVKTASPSGLVVGGPFVVYPDEGSVTVDFSAQPASQPPYQTNFMTKGFVACPLPGLDIGSGVYLQIDSYLTANNGAVSFSGTFDTSEKVNNAPPTEKDLQDNPGDGWLPGSPTGNSPQQVTFVQSDDYSLQLTKAKVRVGNSRFVSATLTGDLTLPPTIVDPVTNKRAVISGLTFTPDNLKVSTPRWKTDAVLDLGNNAFSVALDGTTDATGTLTPMFSLKVTQIGGVDLSPGGGVKATKGQLTFPKELGGMAADGTQMPVGPTVPLEPDYFVLGSKGATGQVTLRQDNLPVTIDTFPVNLKLDPGATLRFLNDKLVGDSHFTGTLQPKNWDQALDVQVCFHSGARPNIVVTGGTVHDNRFGYDLNIAYAATDGLSALKVTGSFVNLPKLTGAVLPFQDLLINYDSARQTVDFQTDDKQKVQFTLSNPMEVPMPVGTCTVHRVIVPSPKDETFAFFGDLKLAANLPIIGDDGVTPRWKISAPKKKKTGALHKSPDGLEFVGLTDPGGAGSGPTDGTKDISVPIQDMDIPGVGRLNGTLQYGSVQLANKTVTAVQGNKFQLALEFGPTITCNFVASDELWFMMLAGAGLNKVNGTPQGILIGDSGLTLLAIKGGIGHNIDIAADGVSTSYNDAPNYKHFIYTPGNFVFLAAARIATTDEAMLWGDATLKVTTSPFVLTLEADVNLLQPAPDDFLNGGAFTKTSRWGQAVISFDSASSTFRAALQVDIVVPDNPVLVHAYGSSELLISPTERHVYVGWPPLSPVGVDIIGISLQGGAELRNPSPNIPGDKYSIQVGGMLMWQKDFLGIIKGELDGTLVADMTKDTTPPYLIPAELYGKLHVYGGVELWVVAASVDAYVEGWLRTDPFGLTVDGELTGCIETAFGGGCKTFSFSGTIGNN
jgi:hypothetical protein